MNLSTRGQQCINVTVVVHFIHPPSCPQSSPITKLGLSAVIWWCTYISKQNNHEFMQVHIDKVYTVFEATILLPLTGEATGFS